MSQNDNGSNLYAVVVVFKVRPEHWNELRSAILANASASLEFEPGCHTFDVCEDAARSEIFLYELYADAAAFRAHLNTAHFNQFNELTKPWIETRNIRTYDKIAGARAGT